ncbi:MAG: ATP-binding cassette domain-containing protein [Litoreibacter sp.]
MLKVDQISVRRRSTVTLQDVSLSLAPQRTLAVVGESGAGKSTLIGAILGLIPCISGKVTWDGAPVRQCRPALVMQEPRSAFNPHMSLHRSVMEPVQGRGIAIDPDRLADLCNGLEIAPKMLNRRPTEVSIGQAQRIGILRALIAAPPLVLFDEPLSALDAVTQKHTARLIAQMQRDEGFAALIVTHDLGYAAAFADNIAVLRDGHIEETTPSHAFVNAPQTEYGRTLRDAAFALGALEHIK